MLLSGIPYSECFDAEGPNFLLSSLERERESSHATWVRRFIASHHSPRRKREAADVMLCDREESCGWR